MGQIDKRIQSVIQRTQCSETKELLLDVLAKIGQDKEVQEAVFIDQDDSVQMRSLFMMLALFGKHIKRLDDEASTMEKLFEAHLSDDYALVKMEHDKYMSQVKEIAVAAARICHV